jgi:hypothetical protein
MTILLETSERSRAHPAFSSYRNSICFSHAETLSHSFARKSEAVGTGPRQLFKLPKCRREISDLAIIPSLSPCFGFR